MSIEGGGRQLARASPNPWASKYASTLPLKDWRAHTQREASRMRHTVFLFSWVSMPEKVRMKLTTQPKKRAVSASSSTERAGTIPIIEKDSPFRARLRLLHESQMASLTYRGLRIASRRRGYSWQDVG